MTDESDIPTPAAIQPKRRIGRPLGSRIRKEPVREPLRNEPVPSAQAGRLVRARKRTDDKFHIDKHLIPDGMTYEWKRESCYGQPDTSHMLNLRDNHWTAVPTSRHPDMMTEGSKGAIKRDGMVLMERPTYVTEDARREDYQLAVERTQSIQNTMGATPAGTMTRDHPSVRKNTRITKSIEPGSIPE